MIGRCARVRQAIGHSGRKVFRKWRCPVLPLHAWDRARRLKICKLRKHRVLAKLAAKLQRQGARMSPQRTSASLTVQQPERYFGQRVAGTGPL